MRFRREDFALWQDMGWSTQMVQAGMETCDEPFPRSLSLSLSLLPSRHLLKTMVSLWVGGCYSLHTSQHASLWPTVIFDCLVRLSSWRDVKLSSLIKTGFYTRHQTYCQNSRFHTTQQKKGVNHPSVETAIGWGFALPRGQSLEFSFLLQYLVDTQSFPVDFWEQENSPPALPTEPNWGNVV